MKRALNSFKFAIRGLRYAWIEEVNFRVEVFFGVCVLLAIYFFNFNYIETIFCIIAITVVLLSEIFNTIVEDICNKIEPNQDPLIAKIKDMSAGLVLLSVLSSVLIGIAVTLNHFY